MFINRNRELNHLNNAYNTITSKFIVIYGKRRVGKTELIKHFFKNNTGIYFLAQKFTGKDNLQIFSELLADHFQDELLKEHPFSTWNQVFMYLKSNVKSRLILSIDEFPYLIEDNKAIPSIFQAGWDEILSKLPIVLILCGSNISMMERDVLGEKSPLFGRRTSQILLKPFRFYDVRKFFPHISFETQLEFYSVLGGCPGYIKQFSEKKSLYDNIKHNILVPEAYLYREVDFLLKEELREPRIYFSILKAIAYGNRKTSEIINTTGIAKNVLHKYLSVLEDLYFINKEIPITEESPVKSRKALYKINDNFLKFYFRFILPNKSLIEEGKSNNVLRKIKNNIVFPVSFNFEDVCKEWLSSNWEKFEITKIGRWWDKNQEIDLIGFDENNENVLFSECKWSNKKVGINIIKNLFEKSEALNYLFENSKKHYALFSKSGFTNNLLEYTIKTKNIYLYDINKLKKSNLK